ncbi:cysteine-type deubiquitinase [Malassezia pachydermatis]
MCAQHALNAILQGHYFDPVQLSQIAKEIQDYEQDELCMPNELNGLSEANHMDESGYFSVEVIDRALKAWDMNLVRWRDCSELRSRYAHPEREFAFLLNLGNHWFALRGFGHTQRQWFNLNSFFTEPQWLGEMYLSTFLQQAEHENYTIFAIQPQDGSAPPDTIADDMADVQTPVMAPTQFVDDEDDKDLQAAIRASLEEHTQPSTTLEFSSARDLPHGQRRARGDLSSPGSSVEEQESLFTALDLPPSGYRSRRRAKARQTDDIETSHMVIRGQGSRRKSATGTSKIEDDELWLASSKRKSPFLHPTLSTAFTDEDNGNDDVDSIEEEMDGDSDVEWMPSPPTMQTAVPNIRDEDEEQLQAVIAASLGQEYHVSDRILQRTNRVFSQRTEPETVPEDVERIRRMRESQSNAFQASPPPSSGATEVPMAPTACEEDNEEVDEEVHDTELDHALTAEELRRRRLARFG